MGPVLAGSTPSAGACVAVSSVVVLSSGRVSYGRAVSLYIIC